MTTPSAESLETSLFREHQRFLWSLSYRMTGSAADADDVVQETFTRVLTTPPSNTNEPWRPWLTKVALNLSRDVLRRRARDGYVGPWLPSPVESARFAVDEAPAAARYDVFESVSFAFLLALEALSSRERAVLLLRDVFDYSVREAAAVLGMSEGNVKTTHHRARRALDGYDRARPSEDSAVRVRPSGDALQRFLAALAEKNGEALAATLAEGARAIGDSGGEFLAQRRIVNRRDRVARLLMGIRPDVDQVGLTFVHVNGAPGVLVAYARPRHRIAPRSLITCDVGDDGLITTVYAVLGTAKLGALP